MPRGGTSAAREYRPLQVNACATGRLPNLWKELSQCCFQTGIPSSVGRNNDPIVHVLSKAWPMRCSIRNFSDIVSGYVIKEQKVATALIAMLRCTLMGSYSHSSSEISDAAMNNVMEYFVHNPPSAAHFAAWIRNNHQHILFVAIKEYIVYLVKNVPSLYTILCERYPWDSFVSSVVAQADYIRTRYTTNIEKRESPFLGIQDGITSMKSFKCLLVELS